MRFRPTSRGYRSAPTDTKQEQPPPAGARRRTLGESLKTGQGPGAPLLSNTRTSWWRPPQSSRPDPGCCTRPQPRSHPAACCGRLQPHPLVRPSRAKNLSHPPRHPSLALTQNRCLGNARGTALLLSQSEALYLLSSLSWVVSQYLCVYPLKHDNLLR